MGKGEGGGQMTTGWLFERLERYGGDRAIVFRGAATTYAALLDRERAWAGELAARCIVAGSVVVVDGGFSPGAVALLLALVEAGAVAVPLVPQSRVHRSAFERIAEVQFAFIFDDEDRWTFERHDRRVSGPLLLKLRALGHPGLVIFSSGSTGEPKAVLHDFVPLLEKFRRPGARKTTLSFLLFDHIGGIDTLFNSLANGGTLVTTPCLDVSAVCAAIAEHRVHTLPTSPTFLNLLLISEAYKQHDLSSLQVIAYGTEPMPESTLARLREVFPSAKLVQTYGMSELGVLRTRSREAGSLWLKFSGEGFETKIVDGVLWVRSPTAMLGYLNAPDLFDEEGWLNTEDAVEVDGEYVRILGRVTDLVNVGGQKVYAAEVENVLMTLENVADVAVYGEPSPFLGQVLAARVNLVKPEPFEDFKKRLRAFCRERLPSYKVPVRIEVTEEQQFGRRLKKMRPKKAEREGST
ncbi:MAG: AMP-binding protein [Myxococcales bacterium]|nr:AMP-binding protein [Myxococcales bacterium]